MNNSTTTLEPGLFRVSDCAPITPGVLVRGRWSVSVVESNVLRVEAHVDQQQPWSSVSGPRLTPPLDGTVTGVPVFHVQPHELRRQIRRSSPVR
jgi:hypothetical protein